MESKCAHSCSGSRSRSMVGRSRLSERVIDSEKMIHCGKRYNFRPNLNIWTCEDASWPSSAQPVKTFSETMAVLASSSSRSSTEGKSDEVPGRTVGL